MKNKFVEYCKQCWKRTQQKVFINEKQRAARANETNALLVGGIDSKICNNTINICGSSPNEIKLDHYIFHTLSE